MAPYPNIATESNFGSLRPSEFKPADIDEHCDPEPNKRALLKALALYLAVMVSVVGLVKFIVTGAVL